MQKRDEPKERRSFIKGVFAGTLALAGLSASSRKAKAAEPAGGSGSSAKEILYHETEEFRCYYQSLRD